MARSRDQQTDAERYERRKSNEAARQRQQTEAGQEIAPLPAVVDPERRELCRDDEQLFELTYFPARFPLPFSPAHLEMSRRLERVIREGGLEAVSFMRGGGKTTLAEVKVIKAICYGLRRYVLLIQATERLATRSLKKIQRELEGNPLLLEDFPEVVYPIRRLERIHARCRGQKLDGRPTMIEWTADSVVLPTVAGSAASGSVIHVVGISGAVKGLSMVAPDGSILRPDMALVDDAQTRSTARSPTQTSDLEATITDDILGLAGPAKTIAAINLCTPIYVNDLSERFLDPDRHPEWNGLRTSMLPKFPDRMDLWDGYAELRRAGQRNGDAGKAATDLYHASRADMDAGAVVTWPERVRAGPTEASSGLELAMILHYHNPRGFAAEYQCQPAPPDVSAEAKELDPKAVAARVNGVARLLVPAECSRLTVFMDVGLWVHWFIVVGWTEAFGGRVVDYGCWPRQGRGFFAAEDARPCLRTLYPERTPAQVVFAGLTGLANEVLGRTYCRQGGGEVRPDVCLVDSGYEKDAVFQWCRQATGYGCPVHPSKGFGRSLTSRGVGEWARRPGEKVGHHWRMTSGQSDRTKSVQYDVDVWKSLVHAMLTTPPPTGLSLFGTKDDKATDHEMLGHHCAAEYSEPATVRGAVFHKWAQRPDRPDNHLFDALTGAACAASVAGLAWSATGEPAPVKPAAPRKSLRDMQEDAIRRFREKQAAGRPGR